MNAERYIFFERRIDRREKGTVQSFEGSCVKRTMDDDHVCATREWKKKEGREIENGKRERKWNWRRK